uniref:Uncharacterized protein n=1 Tax=Anguilla anguilla TaxID=7936 RepID=A0A0E9TFF9_ANGAN
MTHLQPSFSHTSLLATNSANYNLREIGIAYHANLKYNQVPL